MISGYPLSIIICPNRAKNKIPKDHSPKPGLRKKFRLIFKLLEKRIFQFQIIITKHKGHVHSANEYLGSISSFFSLEIWAWLACHYNLTKAKDGGLGNSGKNLGGEAAIQRGKVTHDTTGWWLRRQNLAYETWKQCQWIMRTLTRKHKIWGENWLYLRPYLKAFSVFNVLKTCRVYL